MQDENKRQSPYRGLLIMIVMLIIPPLACYGILSAALEQFSPWGPKLDEITAQVIGAGLGVLFHLMVIVSGAITPAWYAVKYRIREFFENLIVGFGYACKSYWDDVRTDGITFTVFMIIMIANLLFALNALQEFFVILPLL